MLFHVRCGGEDIGPAEYQERIGGGKVNKVKFPSPLWVDERLI